MLHLHPPHGLFLPVQIQNGNETELAVETGAAVDAAIAAGGNYLTVGAMSAGLSPELRSTATSEARKEAVADASSIAETLAEVGWVGVGCCGRAALVAVCGPAGVRRKGRSRSHCRAPALTAAATHTPFNCRPPS